MIGRIGDHVYATQLIRCEGCCATTLDCEARMDDPSPAVCCGCCTHVHDLATLARYGLLER